MRSPWLYVLVALVAMYWIALQVRAHQHPDFDPEPQAWLVDDHGWTHDVYSPMLPAGWRHATTAEVERFEYARSIEKSEQERAERNETLLTILLATGQLALVVASMKAKTP